MAAAETARMIAEVDMRTAGFTRGIKQVERGVDRVDRKLGAFSGAINRNLSRAIDSLAARGVDALAGTIQDASDLNEEITKSQAVFGSASKAVIDFSETTSSSLGLSQKDALAAAGNFGNMFKTIGLADDQSADFSKRMVTLAADMASFNNEDPTEMLDRIRSGLAGEAEPLRRFGVLISAARVQEEAYASGIAKRGEKLTEQQKVQARYNLILKDTAVQQGDVAKTGGNLAGQQRKLNAMLQDISATIGTELLPVVTDLTSEFVKLLSDPATKAGLKSFAKGLGEGAKELVSFAKRLPWQQIGDSLRVAGEGAKTIANAFLSLPPWVQTAVITGWGLNKLTGGGITGLFKGGLDLFGKMRGSSPASPMFTKEVGLGGGGLGGGGKGGRFGKLGGLGGLLMGGIAVTLVGEAFALQQQIADRSTEQANTAQENLNNMLAQDAKLGDMLTAQRAVKDGIKNITSNPLLTVVQGESLDRLRSMDAQLSEAIAEKARPAIEAQAPANFAANQASIASREGGGRTTAEQLRKIHATAEAGARAAQNARSIQSRENDALRATAGQQKVELGNIKNGIATMDLNQKAAALAAGAAQSAQAALQAGRDAAQKSATNAAGSKTASAAREVEIQVQDLNTLLTRRLQKGTDAERPQETDVSRMEWLTGTSEVIGGDAGIDIEDFSLFFTDSPVTVGETDFTGQDSMGVIDDVLQDSGKNAFLYPSPQVDEIIRVGIWFGRTERTDFSSVHRISNVPSDINIDAASASFEMTAEELLEGEWTFPPSIDSTLERDPSRVYSGAMVNYDAKDNGPGYIYVTRPATSEQFRKRDGLFQAELVKSEAQALRRANRYLRDLRNEDDAIQTAVIVPSALVNAFVQGQRVEVRFSYMPGYSADFVWMRIARRTVRQVSAGSMLYEIAMDLRAEEPPDSEDTGSGVACTDLTAAGTFYPLGGSGDTPNLSDGVVYYLNPGINYPFEPQPGHQGHWHFPTYEGGGAGTADEAGACTQSRLRLMVRGDGEMTVNLSATSGQTFAASLRHHQYGEGEEGNPLSGVEVIDQTWVQQDVNTPFVVTISTHNGQNCTHYLDIQDDGGNAHCGHGISFESMVWDPT